MYLVDANVLIEAKNRYYAFDIAPGFWSWLDRAHQEAIVASIGPIRDELMAGDDELALWAEANEAFFRAIDQQTALQFPALSAWANGSGFTPAALGAFTGNNADYLLIAYAIAHGHTVVTHEQSEPNSRKRVKIPDACIAMGVMSTDPFEMMRKAGARLELRKKRARRDPPDNPEIPGLL